MKEEKLKFDFNLRYITIPVDGYPFIMIPYSLKDTDVHDFFCKRCIYSKLNNPDSNHEHCDGCIYNYVYVMYYINNPKTYDEIYNKYRDENNEE